MCFGFIRTFKCVYAPKRVLKPVFWLLEGHFTLFFGSLEGTLSPVFTKLFGPDQSSLVRQSLILFESPHPTKPLLSIVA